LDTNKDVKAKITTIKDEGLKIQKQTTNASSAVLEGVQTIMDNLEERFKPVMLKPSPDAEKYSTEPSISMTLGRTFDVVYRLNLGVIQYTTETARNVVDPQAVGTFLRKNFSPSHIQLRMSIVRQAVTDNSSQICYTENKDLTDFDRRVIGLVQRVSETRQAAIDTVKEAPANFVVVVQGSVQYVGGVLKHLTEARSVSDLAGIGLNESRLAMEGARNKLPFVNSFGILDGAINWAASKEKTISRQ